MSRRAHLPKAGLPGIKPCYQLSGPPEKRGSGGRRAPATPRCPPCRETRRHLSWHAVCSATPPEVPDMYYGYGIGGVVLLIVLILLLTGRL
jgi:hypothetical protein